MLDGQRDFLKNETGKQPPGFVKRVNKEHKRLVKGLMDFFDTVETEKTGLVATLDEDSDSGGNVDTRGADSSAYGQSRRADLDAAQTFALHRVGYHEFDGISLPDLDAYAAERLRKRRRTVWTPPNMAAQGELEPQESILEEENSGEQSSARTERIPDQQGPPRRRGACRNCKEKGHHVAECPHPQMCSICLSVEHLRKECPNKELNCKWCGQAGTRSGLLP